MTPTQIKLKSIFLPVLLQSVCFIIGYTFLHWLLFIKFNIYPLNEEVLELFLPLGLPWLVILIWSRKNTNRIQKKTSNGRGDPRLGIQFVIWILMGITTIIAQTYIDSATGKLTVLNDITSINKTEKTKYYKIQKFYIDKNQVKVHEDSYLSGKHNEDLNFSLHCLVPIALDSLDTTASAVKAWIGLRYTASISSDKSQAEKKQFWQKFQNESQSKFDQQNISQFVYLERLGVNDDRGKYLEALSDQNIPAPKDVAILLPVNEPFESRNGNKLPWTLAVFAGCATGLFLFLLAVKVDEPITTDNSPLLQDAEKESDLKEFLMVFVPKEGFFITPIIIDLNILIFLIMVCCGLGLISFESNELIRWGANYGPATKGGEWWRLLTSTFLHGGLMHVMANMFGFLFVGIFLEPLMGRWRFLFAYLFTGIVASCTSLWWHPAIVSVGASGAIFGIYGVFLTLIVTRVFPKELSKPLLLSTSVFIGYNLLAGLGGGIDNAAHIGGLLSGIAMGLVFRSAVKAQVLENILKSEEIDQLEEGHSDSNTI